MQECLTLKKSDCKNCYKCIRYCPVKAIRFTGNRAQIIENECILCGTCLVTCPQNAKEISSELEKVRVLLQSGDPVIVSLAPSFIANYEGIGIESMRKALKQLGFADVEETAIGATFVKNEYERMLRNRERDIVISSCCHSVNLLIQKHYPDMLKYLADVLSPMQAHCLDIKKRIPDAKTVFIGPCIAKKDEADHYAGITDAVLTFEELSDWLAKEHIELEQKVTEDAYTKTRFFPTAGGVLKTMEHEINDYTYIAVDGVVHCIQVLEELQKGNLHHCFIEMNACVGSCANGPIMANNQLSPIRNYVNIAKYAGDKDFQVEQPTSSFMRKEFVNIDQLYDMPNEMQIKEILRAMGKFRPSDELNCGSCGYNSCRDKAVAIIQGKAEISMCMPHLKQLAENFSDIVVKNIPNGILVLNDNLEVQRINKQALNLLNLRSENDILGEQVVRILDPIDFIKVKTSGIGMTNQKKYLAEYNLYVEQTINYDKDTHMIVCLLQDITQQEKDHERKERVSRDTIEIADKVVGKQMRIVQEIASLLGETTAETKIALTKLKEIIKDE